MSPQVQILAILMATTAGLPVAGQVTHQHPRVPIEILERPVTLRDGIGRAHEDVTTASNDAQAFYDQGLAYLHSYVWIEAARSFHQALRFDSKLAMAYVGLSYALGELGDSEGSNRASQQALTLGRQATDREQMRIRIRAKQLAAAAQPAKPLLRSEYLDAFNLAVSKYPKDVELLLERGQAEGSTHEMPGMAGGAGSIAFYERALAEQPQYFAAHHYLTHADENLARIDEALKHAAEYVRLAPQVPHAHHMYGHVLRRAGRMRDAIAEFRRADELELAYFRTERIAPEWDWHYHHNLDLLGSCYEYSGQMRLAEAVLRRSFDLPSIQLSQELNEDQWPMFLLFEGRTGEALSATQALVGRNDPVIQALGHLLAGRVLMALNRSEQAIKEGDEAVRQMRAARLGGVLLPQLQISQGELLLRTGQPERGRAMLRDAVTKLRTDSRPDSWTQTLLRLDKLWRLSHTLGDNTLTAELARQMAQYDPAYPGTHYALAKVAEQKGDLAAAEKEYQKAIEGWRAADPDFVSLRDAQRQLVLLQRSSHKKSVSPKRP